MLIITRQGIEDLIKRLENPGDLEQCQQEIQQMLEIESELLWWAESGKCCRWQARPYFDSRIGLLKDILNLTNEGNISNATALLREYAKQREDYEMGIVLS
jgi:hypothetical protein